MNCICGQSPVCYTPLEILQCDHCTFKTSLGEILSQHRSKCVEKKSDCSNKNLSLFPEKFVSEFQKGFLRNFAAAKDFIKVKSACWCCQKCQLNEFPECYISLDQFRCVHCTFKSSLQKIRHIHLSECIQKNSRCKSSDRKIICPGRGSGTTSKLFHKTDTNNSAYSRSRSSRQNQNNVTRSTNQEIKPFQVETKPRKRYICLSCNFGTNHKKNLSRHSTSKHADPKEQIDWHNCTKCPYQSKRKHNLLSHISKKHPKPDQIVWYQCDKCDYKVKHSGRLRFHEIIQHAQTSVQWYECNNCPYRTAKKYYMARHQKQKHSSASARYKCSECPYGSYRKYHLDRHVTAKHKNFGEITWFECYECSHKTKEKNTLLKHIREKHFSVESIEWFSCDKCEFKAKRRDGLKVHEIAKH